MDFVLEPQKVIAFQVIILVFSFIYIDLVLFVMLHDEMFKNLCNPLRRLCDEPVQHTP